MDILSKKHKTYSITFNAVYLGLIIILSFKCQKTPIIHTTKNLKYKDHSLNNKDIKFNRNTKGKKVQEEKQSTTKSDFSSKKVKNDSNEKAFKKEKIEANKEKPFHKKTIEGTKTIIAKNQSQVNSRKKNPSCSSSQHIKGQSTTNKIYKIPTYNPFKYTSKELKPKLEKIAKNFKNDFLKNIDLIIDQRLPYAIYKLLQTNKVFSNKEFSKTNFELIKLRYWAPLIKKPDYIKKLKNEYEKANNALSSIKNIVIKYDFSDNSDITANMLDELGKVIHRIKQIEGYAPTAGIRQKDRIKEITHWLDDLQSYNEAKINKLYLGDVKITTSNDDVNKDLRLIYNKPTIYPLMAESTYIEIEKLYSSFKRYSSYPDDPQITRFKKNAALDIFTYKYKLDYAYIGGNDSLVNIKNQKKIEKYYKKAQPLLREIENFL